MKSQCSILKTTKNINNNVDLPDFIEENISLRLFISSTIMIAQLYATTPFFNTCILTIIFIHFI